MRREIKARCVSFAYCVREKGDVRRIVPPSLGGMPEIIWTICPPDGDLAEGRCIRLNSRRERSYCVT